MERITIPAGVTSIGDSAFSGCTALTSITIPDSVMSIELLAFANCTSLKDIYFNGTKAQWNSISRGIWIWGHDSFNITVHCTDGTVIEKN